MNTTRFARLVLMRIVFFGVLVVVYSCEEPLSSDRTDMLQKMSPVADDPESIQQIEGIVSFPDGSHPQGGPYIRAYYHPSGGYVPDSEDEIDYNGHYRCSGDDSNWPDGWYRLETDVIYAYGDALQGSRMSYHEEGIRTLNQNITLSKDMSGPDR